MEDLNATMGDFGNDTYDYEDEEAFRQDTPMFTFVVEGVLLTLISVVGCVGNVFAVLGLARNNRAASANSANSARSSWAGTGSFANLLIALAVADFVYLMMGIVIFGLPVLSTWYAENVYVYTLPVW